MAVQDPVIVSVSSHFSVGRIVSSTDPPSAITSRGADEILFALVAELSSPGFRPPTFQSEVLPQTLNHVVNMTCVRYP